MDANLSMEQIRMDVKNVTALNQEGYDMDVISHKLDLSKIYECASKPIRRPTLISFCWEQRR